MIYILLIFFTLLISILNINRRIKINTIFILMFVFSAIRFNVGIDFSSYYHTIYNCMNNFNCYGLDRFQFLSYRLGILSVYFHSIQIFYFLSSLIICLCLFATLSKHSKSLFVSLAIWFSLPIFFFNSFGFIRQWIAIAIVFYSYDFIVSRKVIKFILSILIASLFHISALLCLCFYVIPAIKLRQLAYIIMCPVFIIILLFINYIVGHSFPQYMHYINGYSMPGGKFISIICIFLYFFNIFFYKHLHESNSYTLSMIGILGFAISNLMYGFAVSRVFLYMIIYILILYPLLFIKIDIVSRKIIASILFISTLLLASIFLIKTLPSHKYSPYQVYFGKNITDLRGSQ